MEDAIATQAVDQKKRRFLLAATTVIGSIGAGFVAAPFILSMTPSDRARALGSPVQVDFSKLEEGQMLTVEWRGQPVWVVRRTQEMLEQLKRNAPLLVDPNSEVESQQPDYAKNLYRSIKQEVFVVIGICTHLGCVPFERFTGGEPSGLGANWPGGYFCPCHGSKFDLAGRVFENVPAPTNLVVPPYNFLSNTRVLVGVDPGNPAESGKA